MLGSFIFLIIPIAVFWFWFSVNTINTPSFALMNTMHSLSFYISNLISFAFSNCNITLFSVIFTWKKLLLFESVKYKNIYPFFWDFPHNLIFWIGLIFPMNIFQLFFIFSEKSKFLINGTGIYKIFSSDYGGFSVKIKVYWRSI